MQWIKEREREREKEREKVVHFNEEGRKGKDLDGGILTTKMYSYSTSNRAPHLNYHPTSTINFSKNFN